MEHMGQLVAACSGRRARLRTVAVSSSLRLAEEHAALKAVTWTIQTSLDEGRFTQSYVVSRSLSNGKGRARTLGMLRYSEAQISCQAELNGWR
eukprot:1688458-Amphidinium_carterae.1